MDAPADRDLVRRVRRGDVEAYGELVRRYQQQVFNVTYRVLRNAQDAEDLAQDAFVRAYERLELYDAARPFGPWVCRIAANLAINALNRRKPVLELEEERDRVDRTHLPLPEQVLEGQERSAAIQAALAALPPKYRAAIELRHFQELTYDEMARSLGLPLNTAKSHLFRARRMLADQLKSSGVL